MKLKAGGCEDSETRWEMKETCELSHREQTNLVIDRSSSGPRFNGRQTVTEFSELNRLGYLKI